MNTTPLALTLGLLLSGCGALDLPSSSAPGTRPHLMRPAGNSAPNFASFHLDYYGGHVIPNIKVYAVSWGSGVDSGVQSQIGGFLGAVTDSRYMDWLLEYDTTIAAMNGSPGTNQQIGRGTFAGSVTITPSFSGSSIDDTQIQAELEAQLTSQGLPSPDQNTLYMVFFPPAVSITLQGQQSCSAFCGYHNTFLHSGNSTYYAVIPDQRSGTCASTCSYAAQTFDENCVVASHEMVEAITDAEIGLASGSSPAPPVAWYDAANSAEIGDICAGHLDTIVGYTVQQEWSNSLNSCITLNPAVPVPTPPAGSDGSAPLIPGTGIYPPTGCDIGASSDPRVLGALLSLGLVGRLARRRWA